MNITLLRISFWVSEVAIDHPNLPTPESDELDSVLEKKANGEEAEPFGALNSAIK